MRYLVISKKIWDKKNFKILDKRAKLKKKIAYSKIKKIKPKIIFFIHWSEKIPKKIFKRYLCIQFHSSDLPYFKGGSPIQNQILRGLKKTKISAFKVEQNFDVGKICMKKTLSLSGSAYEIFKRLEKISIFMINKIIKKNSIKFFKQKGKGSFFSRRHPEESNIKYISNPNLKKIYDFIRMLDADDYPNAFINFKEFKLLLNEAKTYKNGINGKFRIIKKK